MAVERRRGCGFRKIGGLYIVSGGRGYACDRLPYPLEVCPTCGHGIKQTRGFTWIDVEALVGGLHPNCADDFACPLCMRPDSIGRAGLLWIGEKFYKTPAEFLREAADMGISRRISAIPRGFNILRTWILLAHPKVVECPLNCGKCGQIMSLHRERMIAERTTTTAAIVEHCEPFLRCPRCGNETPLYRPGIFRVFLPERIEKIVPESWKIDPTHFEELQDLADKGITPVFVPDDDPDHRGTVYDLDLEDEANGKND